MRSAPRAVKPEFRRDLRLHRRRAQNVTATRRRTRMNPTARATTAGPFPRAGPPPADKVPTGLHAARPPRPDRPRAPPDQTRSRTPGRAPPAPTRRARRPPGQTRPCPARRPTRPQTLARARPRRAVTPVSPTRPPIPARPNGPRPPPQISPSASRSHRGKFRDVAFAPIGSVITSTARFACITAPPSRHGLSWAASAAARYTVSTGSRSTHSFAGHSSTHATAADCLSPRAVRLPPPPPPAPPRAGGNPPMPPRGCRAPARRRPARARAGRSPAESPALPLTARPLRPRAAVPPPAGLRPRARVLPPLPPCSARKHSGGCSSVHTRPRPSASVQPSPAGRTASSARVARRCAWFGDTAVSPLLSSITPTPPSAGRSMRSIFPPTVRPPSGNEIVHSTFTVRQPTTRSRASSVARSRCRADSSCTTGGSVASAPQRSRATRSKRCGQNSRSRGASAQSASALLSPSCCSASGTGGPKSGASSSSFAGSTRSRRSACGRSKRNGPAGQSRKLATDTFAGAGTSRGRSAATARLRGAAAAPAPAAPRPHSGTAAARAAADRPRPRPPLQLGRPAAPDHQAASAASRYASRARRSAFVFSPSRPRDASGKTRRPPSRPAPARRPRPRRPRAGPPSPLSSSSLPSRSSAPPATPAQRGSATRPPASKSAHAARSTYSPVVCPRPPLRVERRDRPLLAGAFSASGSTSVPAPPTPSIPSACASSHATATIRSAWAAGSAQSCTRRSNSGSAIGRRTQLSKNGRPQASKFAASAAGG